MKKVILLFVLGLFWGMPTAQAIPLGPEVLFPGDSDRLVISLYRYEKSNAWWVNLGLPGEFFTPVLKLSDTYMQYALKGLEYGVGFSGWPTEHLQARLTLPFESNTYTDANPISELDLNHVTHSSVRPGDIKLGLSWIGWGNRTSRVRVAADSWVVFPSGISPFRAPAPILASGLGVYRGALGVWASEEVGRFSFFQWINYEKSGSSTFDRLGDISRPGTKLNWPDRMYAGVKVDWRFFRRGFRQASLSGDVRVQHWADWKVGDFVWSPADRIFDAGVALKVRADKILTVEGRLDFFPVEWSSSVGRPEFGQIVTLVLRFHPFEDGQVQ